MTEEKFKILKELQLEIMDEERNIRKIDSLISGCGLCCKISGKSRNGFNITTEYNSTHKEEIIRILQLDREKISTKLSDLKKRFSEF